MVGELRSCRSFCPEEGCPLPGSTLSGLPKGALIFEPCDTYGFYGEVTLVWLRAPEVKKC